MIRGQEDSFGTEALELDPADNCVEIDRIPGAQYVDPSLANYWLDTESTGDLGRAIDAPAALIIAREEFFNSRRQKPQVVRRGEHLLHIVSPAYAVVIDWGTESDNRGRVWFEPY